MPDLIRIKVHNLRGGRLNFLRLAADAAALHPGTRYHVAMPLGIDDLLLDLLSKRATACLEP